VPRPRRSYYLYENHIKIKTKTNTYERTFISRASRVILKINNKNKTHAIRLIILKSDRERKTCKRRFG
jgi:hypothetical protein